MFGPIAAYSSYWSATTDPDMPIWARAVRFLIPPFGGPLVDVKVDAYGVLAVRSGL